MIQISYLSIKLTKKLLSLSILKCQHQSFSTTLSMKRSSFYITKRHTELLNYKCSLQGFSFTELL